jgi:6-phosphogluconolactonase (cycloisomerase 2 family)
VDALIAYVGCRTTRERQARGDGLRVYRVDASEPWQLVQTLDADPNPSFLAVDAARRFLYAVHGDLTHVSAFAIAGDGTLRRINSQHCGGSNPVHLWVDPRSRHVVVANYASGSIVSLPVLEDGSLGAVHSIVGLPGPHGPHIVEQASSHPHQVVPLADGWFIVPDKGLDRLFIARIDQQGTITLDESRTIVAKEAAGPRHAIVHPTTRRLYVADELDSTVATYAFTEQHASRALEIVTTLPTSCVTKSHAAGIAITPDGKSLFVSNRGDDSVACFAIAQPDFVPRPTGCYKSGGRKPRFITLDPSGDHLYVANEDSDSIVRFTIDHAASTLSGGDEVATTGSPVCIVFHTTH